MKIRRYCSSDCLQLTALFHDTVHTVCVKDYSAEQLAAWSPDWVDPDVWQRQFEASYTSVAEQGGTIVGFANMDKTGYLGYLYVHHNFQHKGVATALCNELEGHFSGQTFTTHASITARPFFERRGYRVIRAQEVVRAGVTLLNYVMEK